MYGLLGKSLSHSMSKHIHEYIHPMTYNLIETNDLEAFFKTRQFKGVNVTIPYKKAVIPYCDMMDNSVLATNVVNTIVNTNGFLKAYNTDYLALKNLVEAQFPAPKDANIALVGNGATMTSMVTALKSLGYTSVTIYARTPKNPDERPLASIHPSHTVLINTTPVGMYPHNHDVFPIDLETLPNLELVFDVVYNPLKTTLILDAERRGIKTLSGLSMLVAQAFYSSQLFFNTTYSTAVLEETYKYIYTMMLNITLVGLPFSGKSTYGELLGNLYNKAFIDIDDAIIKEEKLSITKLFNLKGEQYFRTIEAKITKQISKALNQIISTGGGGILNPSNVEALKQNSLIIYLDLAPKLMKTIRFHSRPHVHSYDDLMALKKARHPLYKKASDVIIDKDSLNHTVILKRLEVKINEYIDNQWAKSKPIRD